MNDQLSSIGEKVFYTYFIMVLLDSLLESYQTLVVTLEIRPLVELILQMVTTQLLQ